MHVLHLFFDCCQHMVLKVWSNAWFRNLLLLQVVMKNVNLDCNDVQQGLRYLVINPFHCQNIRLLLPSPRHGKLQCSILRVFRRMVVPFLLSSWHTCISVALISLPRQWTLLVTSRGAIGVQWTWLLRRRLKLRYNACIFVQEGQIYNTIIHNTPSASLEQMTAQWVS